MAQQAYRSKLDRGTDTVLTTGSTPLLRAAKAADLAAMRLLLAKGADPRLATRAGVNPLMIAAGVGTKEEDTTGRSKTEPDAIEAITLLLDAGAANDVSSAVNAADNAGRTALHGAALQGYDQVVRFLAERGATARRQGQARIHAARCRDGTRRWRRIRRKVQQSARKHGGIAA